jgi:hypothetical protein
MKEFTTLQICFIIKLINSIIFTLIFLLIVAGKIYNRLLIAPDVAICLFISTIELFLIAHIREKKLAKENKEE